MRGSPNDPLQLIYVIDIEARVPNGHPLRPIKRVVDRILERLLKALVLRLLYSVRSERQLVERIDTDLLFRWFLELDPEEPVFDATTITHNRARLEAHGITTAFLDAVVAEAIDAGLTSDDHFSVDGSLIESYGSMKRVEPIAQPSEPDEHKDGNGFKSRNPDVDWRNVERTNDTHRSTTDPEARLYRKARGQRAKLRQFARVLVENRNGIVMGVSVSEANGTAEREKALDMVDHVCRRHRAQPRTRGSDRGNHDGSYFLSLEWRGITPYSAMRSMPPGDPKNVRPWRRTWYDACERMRPRFADGAYRASQRCRKKAEESLGWLKVVGGIYRSRHAGRWKIRQELELGVGVYDILRITKLTSA